MTVSPNKATLSSTRTSASGALSATGLPIMEEKNGDEHNHSISYYLQANLSDMREGYFSKESLMLHWNT